MYLTLFALLFTAATLYLMLKFDLNMKLSTYVLFIVTILYSVYILMGNPLEIHLNFILILLLCANLLIEAVPKLNKRDNLRALTRFSSRYPLIAFNTIQRIQLGISFEYTKKTKGVKKTQGEGFCSFYTDAKEPDRFDEFFVHDFYKEIEIIDGELKLQTKDVYGFIITSSYSTGQVAKIPSYIPHLIEIEQKAKLSILCIKKL